jgi:hypothetical protein
MRLRAKNPVEVLLQASLTTEIRSCEIRTTLRTPFLGKEFSAPTGWESKWRMAGLDVLEGR